MLRLRERDLDTWAARPARPPLVLRGARQVGKSWLVRDWGTRRFGNVAELNFERRPELRRAFADTDPQQALRRAAVLTGRDIPGDGRTLLFLDEVQSAPEVLARLRWFAEEMPQLPVVAAGSLLDFALADPALSMPVGRISYLHLEPMGFPEFCDATGEDALARWLRGVTADAIRDGTAIPSEIHDRAMRVFRDWLLVGGMPAAVEAWRGERRHATVESLHRDLVASLRDDFAKYAPVVHHGRLVAILDSVPRQLGGAFVYRTADSDDRAEPLRRAADLLCRARVCHRVAATAARGLPLGADADERRFKLLALDVGLALTSLGLSLRDVEGAADVTLVNRGAVAEQAVGQLLRLTFPGNSDPVLHWWRRDRRGSEAEVDFVLAVGSRVVPVEVKAGATGSLRSLHAFVAERGLPLAVRVHGAPPSLDEIDTSLHDRTRVRYRLLSVPAYLTAEIPRLAAEAG